MCVCVYIVYRGKKKVTNSFGRDKNKYLSLKEKEKEKKNLHNNQITSLFNISISNGDNSYIFKCT